MDDKELIAIAVLNWKRIGEKLMGCDDCNHSEKYYLVVPLLLEQALVSPFRIVASYCSSRELNSQFDDAITASDIIWNCWLMELGAIVQLEMLRFAFSGGAIIPMDVLVSMEIGIELSRLRIELAGRVIGKIGKWMENMEDRIIHMVDGASDGELILLEGDRYILLLNNK